MTDRVLLTKVIKDLELQVITLQKIIAKYREELLIINQLNDEKIKTNFVDSQHD